MEVIPNSIKRQSNFELLRVVCMIMIVFLHTLGHGGGLANTTITSSNFVISHLLEALSIVAVNVYVLISGYFGVKSKKVNISRLINLYLQLYFYSVIIGVIFIVFNVDIINSDIIMNMFFPITRKLWWFMSIFFVLTLLAPYINKLLIQLNKKEFNHLVILLTCIFVLWPSGINILKPIDTSGGYSLYHFIYLYIIGGYINLRFQNVRIKRRYSISIYLIMSIGLATYNIYYSNKVGYHTGIFSYNYLPIVIASIALFLFFKELNIYSNFINKLSMLTLGVYLIHDHRLVRQWVYNYLKYPESFNTTSYLMSTLFTVGIIFISCLCIEYVRQKIFNFILKDRLNFIFSKAKK